MSRRPASLLLEAKERRVKLLSTSMMLVWIPSLLRSSLTNLRLEGVPVKMGTGSDDEGNAIEGSSDVGEGPVIGSELANLAQAALKDEIAS